MDDYSVPLLTFCRGIPVPFGQAESKLQAQASETAATHFHLHTAFTEGKKYSGRESCQSRFAQPIPCLFSVLFCERLFPLISLSRHIILYGTSGPHQARTGHPFLGQSVPPFVSFKRSIHSLPALIPPSSVQCSTFFTTSS